jgi:D-inositol-3-phosphate glycosyltransferase
MTDTLFEICHDLFFVVVVMAIVADTDNIVTSYINWYNRILMISFVWSSKYPLKPGLGGTETYTINHVRELLRRGIATQIVTVGFGSRDGRQYFDDIPFVSYSLAEIAEKDETFVFVSEPLAVTTKNISYVILHVPPRVSEKRSYYLKGLSGKVPIAVSQFGSRLWEKYLHATPGTVSIVNPFATPEFALQKREPHDPETTRVLFAGRLTAEKGVYTLLTAMHLGLNRKMASNHYGVVKKHRFRFTFTTSGDHTPEGKVIKQLLKAHPHIRLTAARTSSKEMAELFARHDVVVMPSNGKFWHEMFGIVSVEAQHSGCRVVASRDGGLPETDAGGLLLVRPDNPTALAVGLAKAAEMAPLRPTERREASKHFTLTASIDQLLQVIDEGEALVYRPTVTTKKLTGLYRLRSWRMNRQSK